MEVIVLETRDNGTIQLDLNTGFCIYRGRVGMASGHLKPACREQITRFATHPAMCYVDLEFDGECRIQERDDRGQMHTYTQKDAVFTASQIRNVHVAEALIGA